MLATTTLPAAPIDGCAVAVVTTDGTVWTWGDLDREFTPALTAVARRKGISACEDLAQDVLLTAVEKLDKFEGGDAGLRSWLFTIAYRRIADAHRSRYRRPEVLVADQAPLPSPASTAEDRVIEVDEIGAVLAAFDVLSTRERNVLERRIFDEVSIAEIADQMALRPGHVRVIQTRALAKLRRQLLSREGAVAPSLMAVAFRPDEFLSRLRDIAAGPAATALPATTVVPATAAATVTGLVTKAALVAGLSLGAAGLGQTVAEPTSGTTVTEGDLRGSVVDSVNPESIDRGAATTASESPTSATPLARPELDGSGTDPRPGAVDGEPDGTQAGPAPTLPEGPLGTTTASSEEPVDIEGIIADPPAVADLMVPPVVDDTAVDVVESTIRSTVESIEDTVNDTVNNTVNNTVNDTVNNTVNDTLDNTVPTVESVEDTVDDVVRESTAELVEGPAGEVTGSVVESVGESVDGTADAVADPEELLTGEGLRQPLSQPTPSLSASKP